MVCRDGSCLSQNSFVTYYCENLPTQPDWDASKARCARTEENGQPNTCQAGPIVPDVMISHLDWANVQCAV